ncbi:MAG: helix-turn-helix transcriptional regulator [Nocardioidaceae bacterium]|nr:helix-turn-helix transcriptional regulator [Nocardioidaceae bacterium]
MSETYGEKVRRQRTERGWTQEELAKRAGLSKRTLQDVEADKASAAGPQRATRDKLDAVLGDTEATMVALIDAASGWPRDVRTMILVIGSWLAALGEARRDAEFSVILARATANGGTT